jgi:hypothetical protein
VGIVVFVALGVTLAVTVGVTVAVGVEELGQYACAATTAPYALAIADVRTFPLRLGYCWPEERIAVFTCC